MQTVILAGGLGTRIASVAQGLPKALIPVAGRPFIEHQFGRLTACGMRDVVLCIGAGGDQIEAHVGDGARWGMRVAYSREDPARLLGTGGALVHALPVLAESFFVMYGDSYLTVDFRSVARRFEASGCPALMTVFRNEGRWDASNTRIEGGRVTYYSKKALPGEAAWIDYGLTAFRRAVIEDRRGGPVPLDMAVILGDLVAAGRLAAFEAPERFYEIGKPEGWAELDARLRTTASGAGRGTP